MNALSAVLDQMHHNPLIHTMHQIYIQISEWLSLRHVHEITFVAIINCQYDF